MKTLCVLSARHIVWGPKAGISCPETVACVLLMALGAPIADIISQSQSSSSVSPEGNSGFISICGGPLCSIFTGTESQYECLRIYGVEVRARSCYMVTPSKYLNWMSRLSPQNGL